MNKIELLAPAGDLIRLKYDVLYGADAVYVGLKEFSLRSSADNFTFEELTEGVRFAHERNVKVYVAFNSYPSDSDKEKIDEYLLKLDEIGIDAIIVSSLYIIKRCQELKVKFERHVSTQESISNSEALSFYDSYDVSRIVLARELTINELKEIRKNTSKDLEVFIHGAMCCSYSGRCSLSKHLLEKDANKGCCAHPCRWEYDIYDQDGNKLENTFLLGSKDLEGISYVKELIDLGISSLKIEGRMKSISYLVHVVKTYRKMIDDIYNDDVKDISVYTNELANADNRDPTVGWLKGYTDNKDLIYTFINTPNKNYLGSMISYDKENQLVLLDFKNPIRINDEIEIISPREEIKSFKVSKIIDPKGKEIEYANNTFFNYWISCPYEVGEFDIFRKKK